MLFQEIDHTVRLHDSDVDIRIGLEKLGNHGEDMQTAKEDRCGDHEIALRRAIFTRRGTLCFLHILEDTLASRDIGSSCVSQAKLPALPG
jgi:hypothetical protein